MRYPSSEKKHGSVQRLLVPCVLSVLFVLLFPGPPADTVAASDPPPLSGVRYWAYQIQDLDVAGAVAKIVNSQYDMVVIEPTVTYDSDFDAKSMVSQIKASRASDGVHRKLVIAYIDIGEAEEWRWYWGNHKTYEEYGLCKQSYINAIQQWAPFVVACDPDGWGGNYPVAFWDDDWKDIAIHGTNLGAGQGNYFNSLVDEVVQDGFDGVYLDWVEAWEMDAVADRAANEGKDPGQEMLKFIKEIRAYGRLYNPDFIVIQQNSSELINEVGASELANAVDAIAQEGVWWDGFGGNDDWTDPEGYDSPSCCTNYYLNRLRKYANAGFPVFVCDYAVSKADEVYDNAATEGFIPYATRRSLARLTTTPPVFEAPPVTGFITLDKTDLRFGATGALTTDAQTFYIGNSGDGVLSWTVSDDAAWLTCSPVSGCGDGSVTVSVNASGLSYGTYTAAVTVTASNASNSPQTVAVTLKVYDAGDDEAPFGSFESPLNNATVRSSIPVTGWVLDDVAVASVKIYRAGNGNMIYIGDALLVEGARPDIETAYPDYPMNYKAGWGYMLLTNSLPNGGNGDFTLIATVTDSSGHEVTLGSRSITCDNANAKKPFGAIDAPYPGQTVSGTGFRNTGWVLTPMPNSIPTDGSTLQVYVDGVSVGNPAYNFYREDIATQFPGYANSNGAHGYLLLDTTQWENGIHRIAWSATDSAGNTDGIGSRYFAVQNSGIRDQGSGVRRDQGVREKQDISSHAMGYRRPVGVMKGFERNGRAITYYPGDDGAIRIEADVLDRLVIHLGGRQPKPPFHPPLTTQHSTLNIRGYLMVNGHKRKLPAGSTLDAERGVFYWLPGPGFKGSYRLLFETPGPCNKARKTIIITIGP